MEDQTFSDYPCPAELELAFETFKKRLPIRALQHIKQSSDVNQEKLLEQGIHDGTIRELSERFQHPEYYSLERVVRDSIISCLSVIPHDPQHCEYLFEMLDRQFRDEKNPVLDLVVATLQSQGVIISNPRE